LIVILQSGELNLEISSPLLLPQEQKGPGDEEVGAGFAMASLRPFLQAPTPRLYARSILDATIHSSRNRERSNPKPIA